MPLTTGNSPELIGGTVATVKKQRVRVLRSFRHEGKTVGVGAVLDLDERHARELRSANKLEFVQADTKLKESNVVTTAPGKEQEKAKTDGEGTPAKAAAAK